MLLRELEPVLFGLVNVWVENSNVSAVLYSMPDEGLYDEYGDYEVVDISGDLEYLDPYESDVVEGTVAVTLRR